MTCTDLIAEIRVHSGGRRKACKGHGRVLQGHQGPIANQPRLPAAHLDLMMGVRVGEKDTLANGFEDTTDDRQDAVKRVHHIDIQ